MRRNRFFKGKLLKVLALLTKRQTVYEDTWPSPWKHTCLPVLPMELLEYICSILAQEECFFAFSKDLSWWKFTRSLHISASNIQMCLSVYVESCPLQPNIIFRCTQLKEIHLTSSIFDPIESMIESMNRMCNSLKCNQTKLPSIKLAFHATNGLLPLNTMLNIDGFVHSLKYSAYERRGFRPLLNVVMDNLVNTSITSLDLSYNTIIPCTKSLTVGLNENKTITDLSLEGCYMGEYILNTILSYFSDSTKSEF